MSVHLWLNASPELRSCVKSALLEALRVEPERSVRRKICDTISEVVKVVQQSHGEADDGDEQEVQQAAPLDTWDELLPVMLECSTSASVDHRESALLIFTAVPALLLGSASSLPAIRGVLVAGLQDGTSMEVRVAALKASVALMTLDALDNKTRNALSAELIVPMASVLTPCHAQETRDEDVLVEGLTAFIELCEPHPKLVKPIFRSLVPFLTAICSDKAELDQRTRQTALELLVTLAENAAPMCRKLEAPGFAGQVIPVVLDMMTELEDDEEW